HALGGARRIAVLDPDGVLPAERRERDDPRVEPRVPHLRDPLQLRPADLATDRYLVDPGPVQLPELLEPAHRPLLELGARADHLDAVARRARVDRERQ